MDLSVPVEAFNWLKNDDHRLAWLELNNIQKRAQRSKIRLLVTSDVRRCAFHVPIDMTIDRLKEEVAKRKDLVDMRVDQMVFVDKDGALDDEKTLTELGFADLDVIGVMVKIGSTFTLESCMRASLEEYRCVSKDSRVRLEELKIDAVFSDGGKVDGYTLCMTVGHRMGYKM